MGINLDHYTGDREHGRVVWLCIKRYINPEYYYHYYVAPGLNLFSFIPFIKAWKQQILEKKDFPCKWHNLRIRDAIFNL